MIQLRNAHAKGERGTGIGAQGCEDMYDANIIELSSVNKANVNRAFELVSLLLRIDDCFYVKDIPKFHK
jgi:chaperonin GroEL (HSP60 family)